MKSAISTLLCASLVLWVCSCDSKQTGATATDTPPPEKVRVLPVTPGDQWIYQVSLEIPSGITSPGAGGVSTKHRSTRTYLGKRSAADGLPEVDCFEVVVPGSPNEREFVEILDDRILMRGSLVMRPETTRPFWPNQPIVFFQMGMRPGTKLLDVSETGNALSRRTEDIAIEDIKVPAGTFNCHRLLTTGNDGEIELRRTVWFSPGNGIIREEKARYRREKLLYREIQELTALKRAEGSK